jgi:hypothetical protein
VWLNYSIHGDESASFEAMMQVAYQLAAGEDSTTRAILDRCLVVMNLAHPAGSPHRREPQDASRAR